MSSPSGPARRRDSFWAGQQPWDRLLPGGLRPSPLQADRPAVGALMAHRDRHSRNSARRGARTGRRPGRYGGSFVDSPRRPGPQHGKAGT
jgi:hypothetical protein